MSNANLLLQEKNIDLESKLKNQKDEIESLTSINRELNNHNNYL